MIWVEVPTKTTKSKKAKCLFIKSSFFLFDINTCSFVVPCFFLGSHFMFQWNVFCKKNTWNWNGKKPFKLENHFPTVCSNSGSTRVSFLVIRRALDNRRRDGDFFGVIEG